MLIGEMILSLILQLLLFVTFLGSLLTDIVTRKKKSKLEMKLKRINDNGKNSTSNTGWEYLVISYNILSVFFIAIISISIFINYYKVLIIIIDQIFLVYLCFFSAWFSNKVIGIFIRIRSVEHIYKK